MKDGIFAVVIDEGAVLDLLVLFFEVCGESWAVASALYCVSSYPIVSSVLDRAHVRLCGD